MDQYTVVVLTVCNQDNCEKCNDKRYNMECDKNSLSTYGPFSYYEAIKYQTKMYNDNNRNVAYIKKLRKSNNEEENEEENEKENEENDDEESGEDEVKFSKWKNMKTGRYFSINDVKRYVEYKNKCRYVEMTDEKMYEFINKYSQTLWIKDFNCDEDDIFNFRVDNRWDFLSDIDEFLESRDD